jgi:hypothetical protein
MKRLVVSASVVLALVSFLVSAAFMVSVKMRARQAYQQVVEETSLHTLRTGLRKGRQPVFLVWGDSHTGMLRYLIRDLSQQYKVYGLVIDENDTVPLLGAYVPSIDTPERQNGKVEETLQMIRDQNIKNIILAVRWEWRVPRWSCQQDTDKHMIQDGRGNTIESASRALHRAFAVTMDELSDRNVYLLMQVPVRGDGYHYQSVSLDTYHLQQSEITRCVDELGPLMAPKVLGPGVWFKDGMSILRDAEGEYYIDHDHLSEHGVQVLIRPLLEPVFQQMAADTKKDPMLIAP